MAILYYNVLLNYVSIKHYVKKKIFFLNSIIIYCTSYKH